MKISEILWKAANEFLWYPGNSSWRYAMESCIAVLEVEGTRDTWALSRDKQFYTWCRKNSPAVRFLLSLGLPARIDSDPFKDPFKDFTPGHDKQCARYAWLMFASMYAAELEEAGELDVRSGTQCDS